MAVNPLSTISRLGKLNASLAHTYIVSCVGMYVCARLSIYAHGEYVCMCFLFIIIISYGPNYRPERSMHVCMREVNYSPIYQMGKNVPFPFVTFITLKNLKKIFTSP